MAVQSSSSSFTYDVYLSFRGEDTRFGFTGNLYHALRNRGIHTFIDDKGLHRGGEIGPELTKAVEQSRIAIVVLSEDYASSSFCLDELAYILECSHTKGSLVVPVFYKIDPSDVRRQTGAYAEAFAKHKERFKHNMDKSQKWRDALQQVSCLSGYHFKGDGYEYEFNMRIAENVSMRINHVPLHFVNYIVGLEPRVREVMSLLDLGSNDVVHMVGIHGRPGIGKTTLAIAVYNRIARHNEGICFLENVKERSNKQGLQLLQTILLSETIGDKNINITSVEEGISIIQHRLQQKKILLLLDDVDNLKQLEALVGKPDWFGPGSTIIITTRDKHLLSRHGVKKQYEVKGLNGYDALRLLSKKAFGTENADAIYEDVLKRIVTYVSGNPFVLEVIGSKLFGKRIKQWEYAAKQLERITKDQTLEKVEVSFDDLEEEESHVEVELKSYSDAFSYDVFLSFRGEDTLHGFTGYLYKALQDNGIHTFIVDDEEHRRGEEITPEIVKAIEESRIAIIVLSINYAFSSSCLDELASIIDCLDRKRMLVLPVFYDMSLSQVLRQIDSCTLAEHKERFKHKLENWKMALRQVCNLSGFHFEPGLEYEYEYEFIGRIVERVSSEVNHTPLQVAGHPIGLEPQVLEVRNLLDVGCDDVLMIGICGIGGVGKSTLARKVYNLIADHFDASCFIENVREKSKKYGLPHLQSILLSKILGDDDIILSSVKQGILMIRRRLQRKKVLLIVDDVDMHEQLEALVGRPYWFGSGSKVIITSRDEELLAFHDVQRTYKVRELDENDAFKLLKKKAFKAPYFDPSYEELLKRAVTYASGLPLSLEIIGSYLFGKSVEEWKSGIHQLEKSPNDPIQSILKASFDALEEKARSIFLDICCCFNGYELVEIQDILDAHYGHSVKDFIDVLVDKSLVKLSHGTITLHDLIEEMGKEIERQESLMSESAKRRRLWLPEDVIKVSGNNKGTSEIEIMCLDFPTFDQEETIEWDEKAFQNMQNLKTIIIRNGNFSNGPEYLPNSLRVLEWWRYPSHHLPSDFHPKELTICKLPYSHISTTELTDLMKKFPNLRVLEFSSANI